MSRTSSILLVDDHAVVRLGATVLLEEKPEFRVCGEAADVSTAKRLTEELQPDLMLLDLMLGGRDGIELIEDLLTIHPPMRILVYSSLGEDTYAKRALRAGARGYMMKSSGLEEVAVACEALARGELYVSEAVKRTLVEQCAGAPAGRLESLSDRELQIFRLLGSKMNSAQIAEELHLSMKTVGTYRERLKNKLGLQNARELERNAESYVASGTIA